MAEWRPRTVSPKKTQWASASSRRGSVSARSRFADAGHASRVAARRPTAANTMEANPETGEWRMLTVFRTSVTPLAVRFPATLDDTKLRGSVCNWGGARYRDRGEQAGEDGRGSGSSDAVGGIPLTALAGPATVLHRKRPFS